MYFTKKLQKCIQKIEREARVSWWEYVFLKALNCVLRFVLHNFQYFYFRINKLKEIEFFEAISVDNPLNIVAFHGKLSSPIEPFLNWIHFYALKLFDYLRPRMTYPISTLPTLSFRPSHFYINWNIKLKL